MLLSENFKDRLKKLAGVADSTLLNEGDKRSVIINRLKLPKEIADWAHNLSEKYAIWIADSFKRNFLDYLDGIYDEEGNVQNGVRKKRAIEILNSPNLSAFRTTNDFDKKVVEVIQNQAKEASPNYEYILDWLRNRQVLAPESDQINFKTLTYAEAQQRSMKWHEELKKIQGGKIEDEDGEVVMTFPDGFYWIRLGRATCRKEANAMGHCGNGRGMLYSLRKDQYPYVTMDVNENLGQIMQMKGRANTKPKPAFHKYIVPFILERPVFYSNSTYQASTDFSVADLPMGELDRVVKAKPSFLFFDGVIAFKKISDPLMKWFLVTNPKVIFADSDLDFMSRLINILTQNKIPLSDVLRNEEMVEWALKNAPKLFKAANFGTVQLTKDQILEIIAKPELAGEFDIDKFNLTDETIAWIVRNNPNMLMDSLVAIFKLTPEDKAYMLKNYPLVFANIMLEHGKSRQGAEILLKFFTIDDLTYLFRNHPAFFAIRDESGTYLFPKFLTSDLLFEYVSKAVPITNDPLKFYESRRLDYFKMYCDDRCKMHILKHYDEVFVTHFIYSAHSAPIGKYLFDHHFDWIVAMQGGSGYSSRGFKFNIYDWELNSNQIEKLISGEIEGKTNLLSFYDADELQLFEFNQEQVNRLLDEESNVRINELSQDIIDGLGLTPESAFPLKVELMLKDTDNQRTLFNEIEETYGKETAFKIYKENRDNLNSLELAVKYKDVEILSQNNDAFTTYTPEGVQFRFDNWQDKDIPEFFVSDDQETVSSILEYSYFDHAGYDYSFRDMADFTDLNALNLARVKYLLKKAFPDKYSKEIEALNARQIKDLFDDPEGILEGWDSAEDEVNDTILDEIKSAMVRTYEDAQRDADEGEAHDAVVKEFTNKFGKWSWYDTTVRRTRTNYETKEKYQVDEKTQLLQFQISYSDFLDYVVNAEKYNQNDDDAPYYSLAIKGTTPIEVIRMGMSYTEDTFKLDVPYYGFNGDYSNETWNEYFSDAIFDNEESNELLNKAKIKTKRVKKKKE